MIPQTKTHRRTGRRAKAGPCLAGVAAICLCGLVSAGEAAGLAAHTPKSLAPLEGRFRRLAAAHAEEPAMKAFHRRLATIREVADRVRARLDSLGAASLGGLLDDIEPPANPRGTRQGVKTVATAVGLLARYGNQLPGEPPAVSASAADREFLRQYDRAALAAAAQDVWQSAAAVMTVERRDADEVVGLCLVLPFLGVADAEWTAAELEGLPDWMKQHHKLAMGEDFALHVCRPFTAFQFAGYRRRLQEASLKPPHYVDYLAEVAAKLVATGHYRPAIHCLRAAIDQGSGSADEAKVTAFRFRLAELFETLGHPQLAAAEMKQILQAYPNSQHRPRAAALRLKYLYGAGRLDEIIREARTYQADERCKPRLAEIMYISWVSQRRQNLPAGAEGIRKSFLAKFPDHLLGADMYFAQAMTALAASDYEEALRLLEIIEYRYPTSRILPKAKQIRQRLEGQATRGDARK